MLDDHLLVVAERALAIDGAVARVAAVNHLAALRPALRVADDAEILELRVEDGRAAQESVQILGAERTDGCGEVEMCGVAPQLALEQPHAAAEQAFDGAVENDE